MLKLNVRAVASIVAALLLLAAWSSGPATAETLIRTAATSGVFPVPVPSTTPRDASPIRTAANEGCACHEGCLRILRTCKSMNEPNCYRDEQKCWMVCNKNHPECRRD